MHDGTEEPQSFVGALSVQKDIWKLPRAFCSALPQMEIIWVMVHCLALHSPLQAAGPGTQGWGLQAGATLFFLFLGIEALSNYCAERTACPLLHVPCPLPASWIVFGRICLVRVGEGGMYFSHLRILRNLRKKEQNVH